MFQNKQLLLYGNQLKYLEQVKRELEARKSKVGNISYRKIYGRIRINKII